jgi:hypothetical protein
VLPADQRLAETEPLMDVASAALDGVLAGAGNGLAA